MDFEQESKECSQQSISVHCTRTEHIRVKPSSYKREWLIFGRLSCSELQSFPYFGYNMDLYIILNWNKLVIFIIKCQ